MKSILESLLFVASEPIKIEKLAKILKIKEEELEKIIDQLRDDYQNTETERGLQIIKEDKKIQLVSKKENSQYIRKLLEKEKEEELSPASLEVLTIIAYLGPILKIEIEEIRGVDSSYILRKLLLRGLIEQIENPRDLRLARYKITFDFLRYLGLEQIKDLPDYQRLKNELSAFIK